MKFNELYNVLCENIGACTVINIEVVIAVTGWRKGVIGDEGGGGVNDYSP